MVLGVVSDVNQKWRGDSEREVQQVRCEDCAFLGFSLDSSQLRSRKRALIKVEVVWEAASQGVNEKNLRRCASFVSNTVYPLCLLIIYRSYTTRRGLRLFCTNRNILTLHEGSYTQSHNPLQGGGQGCLSQRLR